MLEPFPATDQALIDPNGLLAVGGDLSPERLLLAYRQGIFPWFSEDDPILWWTPEPRAVLWPQAFHCSRSLRRRLRRCGYSLRVDHAFEDVMRACAAPRRDGSGTWISEDMVQAYCTLHQRGWAHSIEVWDGTQLVGGLYGVAIDRVFFGESMFSKVTDGSKIALAALAWLGRAGAFELIDCQMETEHLMAMGAKTVSRQVFEKHLGQAINTVMNSATDTALPDIASAPPWLRSLPENASDLAERWHQPELSQ